MAESVYDESCFVSGSGVVFRLKKVNSNILAYAIDKLPKPKVPVVFIPEKEREEENPYDPEYLEAMQVYNRKAADLTVRVYIARGTSIEMLPDGMYGPNDDDWITDIEDYGLTMSRVGVDRYVDWVKYYGTVGQECTTLMRDVARLSGAVPEEDVTKAEDTFRSDEARNTDT